MMLDLQVTFSGIKIRNPVIIASSPLTESFDTILRCEKYGAGAVIAKSCSSTRLNENGYRRCAIDEKGWWASSTYNREIQNVHETVKYLEKAVKALKIPVFASVSELSLEYSEWQKTCKMIQETGVAGIQLDLFYFENILSVPQFSEIFIDLLVKLKKELEIPIFPKLNINLPSLFMASLFKTAKINDVSLLDSISLPAPISLNESGLPKLRFATNIKRASLFGAWQFPLTLKYLYDFQQEGFSVCAGGGIQHSHDIIELLLLGAQTVQIASSIILEGYTKIAEFISGIESFMSKHNLLRISDFRGIALSHRQGPTVYTDVKAKYNETQCTGCNKCVTQSFCSAIKKINGIITINESLCEGCSLCADICPSNALYMA